MPTTFEVISLGNLPLIDTQEGNDYVDQAVVDSWLGTYGSVGNGLTDPADIHTFTPGPNGFGGGISDAYDIDNSVTNDNYYIDGQLETFDAMMQFNAIITYPDGTTANITAVVFQSTNGNVYLAPEISQNSDQSALTAGPIQSIELVSPIYTDNIAGLAWQLVGDRATSNFVPCFTPGTLIATHRGEVKVEDLKPGDRVFTRDNGIQELRWVGVRNVSPAEMAAAPEFQPVLIRKGAIGNGLPDRDLLVSPNHRILITGPNAALFFEENEVLIAAKHMTMVEGIDQVDTDSVTYIHLMFGRHEVILSNGTWTESFLPADYTLRSVGSEQRKEIYALFPELRELENVEGWDAARRSLKRHEAELLLREALSDRHLAQSCCVSRSRRARSSSNTTRCVWPFKGVTSVSPPLSPCSVSNSCRRL